MYYSTNYMYTLLDKRNNDNIDRGYNRKLSVWIFERNAIEIMYYEFSISDAFSLDRCKDFGHINNIFIQSNSSLLEYLFQIFKLFLAALLSWNLWIFLLDFNDSLKQVLFSGFLEFVLHNLHGFTKFKIWIFWVSNLQSLPNIEQII